VLGVGVNSTFQGDFVDNLAVFKHPHTPILARDDHLNTPETPQQTSGTFALDKHCGFNLHFTLGAEATVPQGEVIDTIRKHAVMTVLALHKLVEQEITP